MFTGIVGIPRDSNFVSHVGLDWIVKVRGNPTTKSIAIKSHFHSRIGCCWVKPPALLVFVLQ